jgi:XTP/dITP diphosphohydrolase
VALISPRGRLHFFRGRVYGHLLEARRCKPQPKMPYSPIFVPEGSDLVFAQMTVEQENEISHRGQAFRQVRKFFEVYSL